MPCCVAVGFPTRMRHVAVHLRVRPRLKKRSDRFRSNTGSYTTIGVMLGGPNMHGKYLVQDLLPGSPAHLVGKVKRGDIILQVDSEDVGAHNIVDKMRGSDAPGSSVSIRVTRPGRKRPLDVTVLRAPKESVEHTRQTFDMISQLALLGGAGEADDDIESPASELEKELHRRLISLEQEKLQQEVVLQEKETTQAKLLASVTTLVSEFASIAGGSGGAEGSAFSQRAPSTGTDMGTLRDTALKVGRATRTLEDRCSALRARVAGKLLAMDGRLKRMDERSAHVRQAFAAGNYRDHQASSAAAALKLSDAATKLVQLQEAVARYEKELLEVKQENSTLASQAGAKELKISLLESKVQQQASTIADSKLNEDTALSASSAEPGGPAVDNSAGESKRLVAEISKLKEEMARQKQQHDDEINERDKSLSDLSSSLFNAQDRASASMSELVTLRMENLKLKEQAVEKERKLSASERQNGDEVVVLRANLDKQTKACKELEALYMQVQQKYVEASQELTRKTKEASARVSESEEHKMEAASAQQTIDSLKELLRRESSQLQEARTALELTQDKLQAAETETQATTNKYGVSENLRTTLEEKLASSEQLRKNMEETFNRERQDGLLAMRERDSLKRQRNNLQLEIEKLAAAKDREMEEAVQNEQLRWKDSFEAMEQRLKAESQNDASMRLEMMQAGGAEQKEALEQAQRELEDKRREGMQAKRERDGLKAELDESRYVIGQLTSEVNDLRNMLSTGMMVPVNVPIQRPLPKAQRGAPPLPGQQLPEAISPNGEVYELIQSPVGSAHSQSPSAHSGSHGSHHSQSPGTGAFPPTQQAQFQLALGQPELGMGERLGSGTPAKPVGVYSNRAGRLFAM